jgi:hypothetical protein
MQHGKSSSLNKKNEEEEDSEDPCNVILEPHILRLLRLIQYPSPKRGSYSSNRNNVPNDDRNEYADHAARMLGQVTSRSSPLVLWDVLGRLRHMLLHSALWSTRQCVALAMTLVSSHLPGKDQEEFISGITCDGGKEEDMYPLLWLTVSDLVQPTSSSDCTPTNGDRIALDVVLRKGSILLSRMESSYDCTPLDHDDHYLKLHTIEDSILNTLDTKAIHRYSSATSQPSSEQKKTLMDARLQYQRSVMARRLGLAQEERTIHAALPHTGNDALTFAQNFVAQELLTHSFLTEFITQQDIIINNLKQRNEASEGQEGEDYTKRYHKNKSKRTKQKKLPQPEVFGENAAKEVSNNFNSPSVVKKKERRTKAKTKQTSQHPQLETSHDDEDYGTVRALLVLEMRSDTSTNGVILSSKSHARPRTLLATDLLYSMFHPNWQTRHGACLGILALCKAWLPTAYNKANNTTSSLSSSSSVAFGSWLQDILARSVCVLALDRFGDFSDDDKEGGGGVVAPVRLAASQLLALLWNVAPLKTQVQTLRLLHHMIVVSQLCYWEIRHGSMLALYYICSTTTNIPTFLQVNNNSDDHVTNAFNEKNNGNGVNVNCVNFTTPKDPSGGGLFDILYIASRGLVDDSDDVRSVSSRVILQLLRHSSSVDGNIYSSLAHCNSPWRDKIISVCTPPLWIAIQQARSVSSCVSDLLSLLEGFITVNALSVVCNILQSTLTDVDGSEKSEDVAITKNKTATTMTMHEIQQLASSSSIFNVICQILEKLIEFLDYEYISCQISSLDVLAKVMEPIYGLTNSLIQGNKNCHGFYDDDDVSKHSSSAALTLVGITCHLLIKMYNSFWETNCYIDSDPKYKRLFQDARGRCWGALTEAIAECSSNFHLLHLPAFTELISKMYATLLLSYFGIMLINPQASPSRGSALITAPSSPNFTLLAKENNYCQRRTLLKDDVSYENQVVGATALADISAKLFESYSPIESGRPVEILSKNVLHLLLHVMLESPWQDLFEAGVLFYTAAATASRNHETMNNFLDEHDSIMGPKVQKFIDMLHQEVPFCFFIEQYSPVGAPLAVCNATRKTFCDETLVAALQSLLFHKTSNDRDINNRQSIVKVAHGVTNVWRRLFVCNAKGISFPIVPGEANLNLTRLRGEISCAIISRGVKYTPTQLRLVTQTLMASLQCDSSLSLQKASCQSLADLVLILSNGVSTVDVDNTQQRHSLCKEVFVTICSLVYSSIPPRTDEDTELVDEKQISVGILISRLLSGVHSPESLILSLMMSEFDPLINVYGDIDAQLVKERLYVLKVISVSIHKAPSMIDMLALKLLFPVSLIACNSPSAFSRQLATATVTNFCVAKSLRCVPIIVPVIFDSLRVVDDDARRFGGARLLHAVVESLGIQICPFVKCFLPAVMSTLNDPVDACARTAASTFALLVRAAPLVVDERMDHVSDGKSDPLSINTCKPDGLPHFFERDDETSSKVVDHLIHGKPLPSYSMPSTLNASMKGVQLRSYQKEGIAWIRFLASVNLNGVLADDMVCYISEISYPVIEIFFLYSLIVTVAY